MSDPDGGLVAPSDNTVRVDRVLNNFAVAPAGTGSSLDRIVRLNAVAARVGCAVALARKTGADFRSESRSVPGPMQPKSGSGAATTHWMPQSRAAKPK